MGGGRDASGDHHLLAVGFGCLESGRLCDRTEARDPGLGAGIDETGDERRLGPGDDKVATALRCERDETGDVVGRDRDDLGVGCDPGVARGADQLGRLRRALERADDRVLTPAASDYEYAGQIRSMR